MSTTTNTFSREVRDHAVGLVLGNEHEHASRWATVGSIAAKISCIINKGGGGAPSHLQRVSDLNSLFLWKWRCSERQSVPQLLARTSEFPRHSSELSDFFRASPARVFCSERGISLHLIRDFNCW